MEEEKGMGYLNDVLARGLELNLFVKDIQGNQELYTMNKNSKIAELIAEIKHKTKKDVALYYNSRLLDKKKTFIQEQIKDDATLHEKIIGNKSITLFIKGPNGETFNREFDNTKTLKQLFPNYIESYAISCNAKSLNIETPLKDLQIQEKSTLNFVIRTLGGYTTFDFLLYRMY